jgi:recombination protein RecR
LLYTPPIARLVEELSKLPGIGQKTAQRLAFHILRVPGEEATALAEAIVDAREKVSFCTRCFNFAQGSSANTAWMSAGTPSCSVWSKGPRT